MPQGKGQARFSCNIPSQDLKRLQKQADRLYGGNLSLAGRKAIGIGLRALEGGPDITDARAPR